MSMQDPVADMITRIRNGQLGHAFAVKMPASKIKIAIAKVLEAEGYVNGYETTEENGRPQLTVHLKYFQGSPVINRIKRISRPGLRIYRGKTELPKPLDGLGISIISTSQGVMSDHQARALGQGGEVLCTVE